jgi:hypothetical protein
VVVTGPETVDVVVTSRGEVAAVVVLTYISVVVGCKDVVAGGYIEWVVGASVDDETYIDGAVVWLIVISVVGEYAYVVAGT